MFKFLLKLIVLLIVIILSITTYLTYFGIETKKFDYLIKKKANEVNQNVKLQFNKTKIYLSPIKLNLTVKLKEPKVIIKNNEINLTKLNLFLSIKSYFTSSFLLQKIEIAFAQNDIKDLTKITNIFVPKIINNQISKIFEKGKLEGKFIIPFKDDGSIGKDYAFSGKILNASLNLPKGLTINNFTSEVSHKKKGNSNLFNINVKKGSIFGQKLEDTIITFERVNKEININSFLHTKGDLNFEQIKKLSNLFNTNITSFKNIEGKTDLKTDIQFKLDKNYRVKNLNYSMEGDISYFYLHLREKKIYKKIFSKL